MNASSLMYELFILNSDAFGRNRTLLIVVLLVLSSDVDF